MDKERSDRHATDVVVLAPYRTARGRDDATIRRYRIARLRLDPPRRRDTEPHEQLRQARH